MPELHAHSVFFTLKDASEAAKAKLVEACHKYLKDHPGVLFFAAGTRVVDCVRPVNDLDFDVSLHMLFATKADHDAYQSAPKHDSFIEESKPNWARVRVFDSSVTR